MKRTFTKYPSNYVKADDEITNDLSTSSRKPIPCEIVFNTRWGYEMQPVKCKSIREALRLAEERGMAYRIFVDGKCVKRGWRGNPTW